MNIKKYQTCSKINIIINKFLNKKIYKKNKKFKK